MIIPCPYCNTKFKIDEKMFGDKKLIKFQCSKCKTVFRFDRTSGSSWHVDEEKTMPGIPDVDDDQPRPSYGEIEREETRRRKQQEEERDLDAATNVYLKQSEAQPVEESYEDFEAPALAAKLARAARAGTPSIPPVPETHQAPLPAAPVSQDAQEAAPAPAPSPAPAGATDATDEFSSQDIEVLATGRAEPEPRPDDEITPITPGPPAVIIQSGAEPAPMPKTTVPPARQRTSSGARQILSSDLYVLELEYELQEKALKQASARTRVLGLTALIVLGLLTAVYILVSWKNDWDFAALFTSPQDAVAIALGSKTKLKVAPEAEGLEAAVTSSYATETSNGIRVLVVEGEVLNTSVFPKKQIRVYVEIKTTQDQVAAELEVPTGITRLSREQVEEKTWSGLSMYQESERKNADDWIVNANRKVEFQAFLKDAPSGAENSNMYTIEATAISAVNALQE